MNINDEWKMFLSGNDEAISDKGYGSNIEYDDKECNKVPVPTPIYISTKTKIAYLSNEKDDFKIDIIDVFWKIPIIMHTQASDGIIKKQIMIKSSSNEQLEIVKERLAKEKHYDELIITSINNPDGRIKFKDKRKISIGICKKDIISSRCKKKSAFDNCFVLIMRMCVNNIFKEYHIKVFNTGKIEVPGVKDEDIFNLILNQLVLVIQPHIKETLVYKTDNNMEVLINSNFNCGFNIKRDVLYKLLKYDYNIPTIYDPCMYPGIQCKYNIDSTSSSKKVSFMIFRTGSVLIMGKCKQDVLYGVYDKVSNILIKEYSKICHGNHVCEGETILKEETIKKKKQRKKLITLQNH